MADAGCDLRHSPLRAPGESIAEGLRCLGTLFARVAGVGDVAWLGAVSDYLIRCADTLTYLICLLDARLPGWRSHIHEGELP
ncbi:hypothetical protein [Microcella sp.]|uniref:hypothetical protein n=1 Tax=Microcella sp. TaxID=1913979 RepID=UPI0033147498